MAAGRQTETKLLEDRLERIAWAEASTNVSWRRETHDVGSSCAWQLAFVENVQSDLDQSTAS
jgi:hypothetical protein